MGARGRSADSDRIDVGREWVAEEVSGCQFPDQRLGSRLHSLMGSLGAQVGSTIPTACEDWASIKAAYRFLSNDRVDEHAILSGHMKATARRIRAADGPILILHDRVFVRPGGSGIHRLHQRNALCPKGCDKQDDPLPCVRCHDAFKSGNNATGVAIGAVCRQVLESQAVQGHTGAQEQDQPHPDSDRGEGKLPVAAERESVHGVVRRCVTLCTLVTARPISTSCSALLINGEQSFSSGRA